MLLLFLLPLLLLCFLCFFQYFILSKIYFRFGLFDVDIHNLISWIHGRINAGEVPIFPLC